MTSFHGNRNGISIPHFRFSAALCQLRAVNAIWLTARIQNSSILKWQRERKRKCLPSHFAFLPLKRTQFDDRLRYWLTVIRHLQGLVVPLLANQFKCLFYPSQSSLPHYDLTGLGLPSWLSTCCSRDGPWIGKWSKCQKEFSVQCSPRSMTWRGKKKRKEKEKYLLVGGVSRTQFTKSSLMRECQFILPLGFSISEQLSPMLRVLELFHEGDSGEYYNRGFHIKCLPINTVVFFCLVFLEPEKLNQCKCYNKTLITLTHDIFFSILRCLDKKWSSAETLAVQHHPAWFYEHTSLGA